MLNILLGHYFSTTDAGNFNQAYQWNFKCYSLIQNMVAQVSQPVLVDLQDDAGRQTAAFRKLMRFTAFVSFPLLFGFGIVAHEFIILALTEKWEASATLIQMLCVAGAITPISTLLGNAIISCGRSGTFFRATLGVSLANIAIMCTLWPWGIHVMVVAYVVVAALSMMVWHVLAAPLLHYGLWPFLKDIVPFALAALATSLATWIATEPINSLWLKLLARIAMAAVLYYAVMRIAGAHILQECIGFIKKKRI